MLTYQPPGIGERVCEIVWLVAFNRVWPKRLCQEVRNMHDEWSVSVICCSVNGILIFKYPLDHWLLFEWWKWVAPLLHRRIASPHIYWLPIRRSRSVFVRLQITNEIARSSSDAVMPKIAFCQVVTISISNLTLSIIAFRYLSLQWMHSILNSRCHDEQLIICKS